MITIRYYKFILSLLVFTLCFAVVRGDVKARYVGLESNGEYMELLEAEQRFVTVEDSLDVELHNNRRLYREGGASVALYRQKIVDLEQSLFDIRVQKRVVESQINAIEQSWVLDNVSSGVETHQVVQQVTGTDASTNSGVSRIRAESVKNIHQSQYVKENLPTVDFDNLLATQDGEVEVSQFVKAYVSNFEKLAQYREVYNQSSSQSTADSVAAMHKSIDSVNFDIAKSIDSRWSQVVDAKSYSYALLIEALGRTDIFKKEEQFNTQAMMVIDSLSSSTNSPELLNYYATKLSMVEYEMVIANELSLTNAVDSLKSVRDSLKIAGFDFPSVDIEKRSFILYEPIKFSSKETYTSKNPIPAIKIYDEGVIYRLLLGSYKMRQLANIFRGTSPLAISKNSLGLYCYYAGGYETLSEAEEARKLLLKRGFRRPEIVEWRDGNSHNLTRNPRESSYKYRVEIKGASELSDAVKEVVATQASGRELLKIGPESFVIGVFDDRESATTLHDGLKAIGENLDVSIATIEYVATPSIP